MTVLWGMHDAGVAAFAQLLRASVDGGLFVLTVLLLVRVVPSLPARAVTIAWWLASVRFLVGLAWIAPLPLPVLPPAVADAPAQVLASLQPAPPAEGSWSVVEAQPSDDDATSTASGAAPARQLDPRALAAFAWVGLTSVLVLRTGRRAWQTSGLLREASPPDDRLRTIAGEAAQCIGLPRAPAMLVSHVPAPPQVVWLGRPTVLLSCHDVARLDDEALMWLVAHEFLHVKQRDGWWAWGPALAAHLFAFHPLARLAAREFVAARESVCDLGVLQHAGAMPREYGRLLVRLGVARSTRAVATAASSPTVKTLKRRLIMLERWSPDARRLTARAVLVLVLLALGMVPLQLVAMRSGDEAAREAGGLRAFGLASDSVQAPPAAPAPPAPPAPPAYTHETQPVPPPAPPAAPEAPPPPPPPPPMDLTVKGQPVEGWALTSADGGRTMGHWVDGAQRRSHLSGPSFWFRHDGREYVVRDAAVLAEIERALAPMSEVGRRQGEIGRQQGEIGRRQGEVGRQQAQFARQQARESLEKARAAVRDAARHQAVRGGVAGGVQGGVAGGVEDAVKAAEEAVELAHRELERALAEQDEHRHREAAAEGHAEAARDHEELAQQMRQLSEQMRPLADEQAALSREMRRAAAAAMTDLGAILERALASGAAQPATPR